MSIGSRLCALALWAATGAAAQQIPTEPTEPVRLELSTVAAPCELPEPNLLRMRDEYKAVLYSWLDGGNAASELDSLWQRRVDAAARFEVTDETVRRLPAMPSGRIIVPAIGCQERVESDVLRAAVYGAPEVTEALVSLYLELYRLQITPPPPRRWTASRSRDRILWLVAQHRQAFGGGRAGRASRSRMLLMLAAVMREAPYQTEILEARSLLERILDLDPRSLAARYMAATLAERTGDYEIALRELGRLMERLPDEEIALRLAVNRARTGDERKALAALEDIARGTAPAWIRIVAYQEWTRLAARRRGISAQTVVREGIGAFPEDLQLKLQLAALQVRESRWAEADRTLLAAALHGDSPEISPRLRYDLPRQDELSSEVEIFLAGVEAGRVTLRGVLRGI